MASRGRSRSSRACFGAGRGAARAGAAGRHAGGPRRDAPGRGDPPARRRAHLRAASRRRARPRSRRRASDGMRWLRDVRAAARSRPRRAGPRPGRDPRRRRGDLRSAVDPRDVRMGVDPLRRGALLRRPDTRRGAGAVVAYCAGWIIFDELHVNNLAVDPPWRRRGVASALLTFVLEAGRRGGRHPRDAGGPAVERAGPAPLRAVRLRLRRRPHRLLPAAGGGCARPVAERAASTVVKPEIRRPHRPVESPGRGVERRKSGGTVVTSRSRVGIRSRSHGPTAPHGASDRGGRAWPSR